MNLSAIAITNQPIKSKKMKKTMTCARYSKSMACVCVFVNLSKIARIIAPRRARSAVPGPTFVDI